MAGMQYHLVSDSDIITDDGRVTAGLIMTVVGDMDRTVVLYVAALADADPVYIATHHSPWPNGTVITKLDVTNYRGLWVDVNAFTDVGFNIVKAANAH